MLLVILAFYIHLARCSQKDLMFSKQYAVTLAKEPKLAVSLSGDIATLNPSSGSPITITSKSGGSGEKYNYGDPVNLFIDGKKMCSDDDKLKVCSGSSRDEFRIKTQGNGYRIKTQESGMISKAFKEECLEKDDGKLKMKKCKNNDTSQIFLFEEFKNANPAKGNAGAPNGPVPAAGGVGNNPQPCVNRGPPNPLPNLSQEPAMPEIIVDGKPFKPDFC